MSVWDGDGSARDLGALDAASERDGTGEEDGHLLRASCERFASVIVTPLCRGGNRGSGRFGSRSDVTRQDKWGQDFITGHH